MKLFCIKNWSNLDSTAVSIFVVILVETANIETTVLSSPIGCSFIPSSELSLLKKQDVMSSSSEVVGRAHPYHKNNDNDDVDDLNDDSACSHLQ